LSESKTKDLEVKENENTFIDLHLLMTSNNKEIVQVSITESKKKRALKRARMISSTPEISTFEGSND
jgi:hypothetical protein